MIIFKEISIKGLFAESDVIIPIKDNRIILVGYNGIGKSTILNIFYYFISQQWAKLVEQDFVELSVEYILLLYFSTMGKVGGARFC